MGSSRAKRRLRTERELAAAAQASAAADEKTARWTRITALVSAAALLVGVIGLTHTSTVLVAATSTTNTSVLQAINSDAHVDEDQLAVALLLWGNHTELGLPVPNGFGGGKHHAVVTESN